MIMDKIRETWMQSRKDGDKNISAMLGSLIGEIENKSKEKNAKDLDTICLAMIKTFIANADTTIHLTGQEDCYEEYRASLSKQICILKKFQPIAMTEDEIREFFVEDNIKNLKDAMQRIKTERAGQYDGKLASQIAKEMFVL